MVAMGIAILALGGLMSNAGPRTGPAGRKRAGANGQPGRGECNADVRHRRATNAWRRDRGRREILAALANDPDADVRLEARFRRSKLLQARGANVEAAVLLRQIVDNRPSAIPARLELAQLLHQMGDHRQRLAASAGRRSRLGFHATSRGLSIAIRRRCAPRDRSAPALRSRWRPTVISIAPLGRTRSVR